jgi:hypothetical protein
MPLRAGLTFGGIQPCETTMRTVLAFVAALSISAIVFPHEPAAQQVPSSEPRAAPAAAPNAKAPRSVAAKKAKRGRKIAARHRIPDAGYNLCDILNGWRAFPSRKPGGFFKPSRTCRVAAVR